MEIGAPTPVQAPAFFTEMVSDAKPGWWVHGSHHGRDFPRFLHGFVTCWPEEQQRPW